MPSVQAGPSQPDNHTGKRRPVQQWAGGLSALPGPPWDITTGVSGEAISTSILGSARVVSVGLMNTLSLPVERRVGSGSGQLYCFDLFGPGGHGRRWTVFSKQGKEWRRHSNLLTIEEVRSLG